MPIHLPAALKRPFWRILWEVRGQRKDLMASGGLALLEVSYLDRAVAHVVETLRPDPARDTVLDIGCGVGYAMRSLAPRSRHVSGCDASSALVARAREAMQDVPNAEVFQAEAARIPKPDGSYSRIVCYGVAHYFPSRAYLLDVLREVRRLLTADGLAMIGDVSERGKYDFDIADQMGPVRRAVYKASTVVIDTVLQTRFSRAEFAELATAAGLDAEIRDQPADLAFHQSRFDVILRPHRDA